MMLQIIACGFCVLQKRPFFLVFCPSLLFIVFLLFFIVFPFCPFYYPILSGIILLLLKSIFFFINIGFLCLPVSLIVNGLPLFRVVSSRHIIGLLFRSIMLLAVRWFIFITKNSVPQFPFFAFFLRFLRSIREIRGIFK